MAKVELEKLFGKQGNTAQTLHFSYDMIRKMGKDGPFGDL
jgi:hypothetical protein